jgi:hypothetical protein
MGTLCPEPIPAEIRHGASLTAEPTVFDQFDEGHSTNLLLSVDRSAEWSRKPIVAKPRKRLFHRADKKLGGLDAEAEMMVEVDREIY